MRKKSLNLLCLTVILILAVSCSKDDGSVLGGAQSPIGTVGNTFDWNAGQFGISDASMRVTQLEGGVSTFEVSGTTSNSAYTDLLKMVPTERFPGTFSVSGNSVTAKVNSVVTDNGAQVVFNDGSRLTLVNYGASVGDKYTATVGGTTLQNEVISKSTEDDYLWMGGMYLKVIEVKYTSHSPGINYVVAIYNHKFGLVGLEVHFEDGSVKYAGCESANSQ